MLAGGSGDHVPGWGFGVRGVAQWTCVEGRVRTLTACVTSPWVPMKLVLVGDNGKNYKPCLGFPERPSIQVFRGKGELFPAGNRHTGLHRKLLSSCSLRDGQLALCFFIPNKACAEAS